jgi:bifunctional non-homologous end joining protein LigD
MTVLADAVGVQLLTPCDVSLVGQLIEAPDWAAQPKYDGDRMVIHRDGRHVWGQNRRQEIRPLAPPIREAIQALPPGDVVLDGELVGGQFLAFDALYHGDMDLRTFTFAGRWQHLLQLVPERGVVQRALTVWERREKEHLFQVLADAGQEGIVFRRRDAKYVVGRQPTAYKCKYWKTLTGLVLAHNATRQAWAVAPLPYELEDMHGRGSIQVGLIDGTRIINTGDVTVPGSRTVPPLGSLVEIRYIYAFPESKQLFHSTLLRVRTDLPWTACTVAQLQYKR